LKDTVFEILDWGRLGYHQALQRQLDLVEGRINGSAPDRLVLVEHPSVVTLGRSGSQKDLCISEAALQTFHGPGQLVAYPIVKVSDKDLHAFLKRLLDTIADVLRSYQLVPEFKKGKPGVWVNGAKIASVGLAVRKWVTYHGIALNVCTDPRWFDLIVPCGQPGEKITSMDREMGVPVDISDVKKRFAANFCSRHHYAACEKIKAKPSGRQQTLRLQIVWKSGWSVYSWPPSVRAPIAPTRGNALSEAPPPS
jgi:lipoic acid synthetase